MTERVKAKLRKRAGERGVALLVVLLTLAMVAPVIAEFRYTSRIDLRLAANARDELQAEYNALGALQLRALLLRQSRKLQSALGGLGDALGGDASSILPIGQLLDMIPVECGVLSAVLREAEPELSEDSANEDEGFFTGDCLATSQSEHSKIPINMLGSLTQGTQQKVMQLLYALLSSTSMERHFDEDDRNGTHAEEPAELVAAIADWVDPDDNQTGNEVGDEERFYAYLPDTYRVKNAPFDSLAELQLVHGVDDELYDILKDKVSIYNATPNIELGTATDAQIMAGLAASLPNGVNPAVLLDSPVAFATFLAMLREVRELNFGSIKVEMLNALVQQSGLSAVIDTAKLQEVFSDRSSTTWYTINAQGMVGNVTKRITAVFQANEGQFYYFRVE